MYTFRTDITPVIKVNGHPLRKTPQHFYLKGFLHSVSDVSHQASISREFAPSTDLPIAVERFTLTNHSAKEMTVEIEDFEKRTRTQAEKSVYGVYELSAKTQNAGLFTVKSNASVEFAMVYSGRKISETDVQQERSTHCFPRFFG